MKSGKGYRRHHAIDKALATPNYGMERGIVFAESNVACMKNIDYLPIYMVSQLIFDDSWDKEETN